MCVFTSQPQKQYRTAFAERGVRGVGKVIGVEKLRKNYGQFEQRRKLCDSYDLFLADRRILPRLPSLLGQRFFVTKKFPLFISLDDGADWQAEIDRALRCSSLTLAGGGTLNVKVGRVSDKHASVADNILAAMDIVVTHIGGWDNVRSLFVKTPLSMSVPIFTAGPLARDTEIALRQKFLDASADVQTHGPAAKKARKQAIADFEAKLAADPRGEKKREYSFLTTEYGIEIEDDLLSDSTGDDENGAAVVDNKQPIKKAKKANDNDDDDDDVDEDDDDDDDNKANGTSLVQHEAKRLRRLRGTASKNEDDNDDEATEAAALALKAKQMALAKGGAKQAVAAAKPSKSAKPAKPATKPAKETVAAAAATKPAKETVVAAAAAATKPSKPSKPSKETVATTTTPAVAAKTSKPVHPKSISNPNAGKKAGKRRK